MNTTSPNAAASAGNPALAFSPACLIKSVNWSGWRDEKRTWCPASAQRIPMAPPIRPEPMIPIFKSCDVWAKLRWVSKAGPIPKHEPAIRRRLLKSRLERFRGAVDSLFILLLLHFLDNIAIPYKNQTATAPHHKAKNQSFLVVPFHSNHSNTMPSINKSKESKTKNPNTHVRKKRSVFMLIHCFELLHGDTFGEITRLVNVASAFDGDVIGEQL